jgi:hypothetical protein
MRWATRAAAHAHLIVLRSKGAIVSKGSMSAWRAGLLIVVGAVVLLVPALLNGFPFVFDDSADYLVFTPHIYRSPYYGLLLFFFHLNTFIWSAVIVQALILSHLIWLWVRILVIAKGPWIYAACICLLTAFSSLPLMAGYLMADAFTAVMVLAIGILAFHLQRLNDVEKVYVFLLACVSIVAHVSHLVLSVALLATVLIVYVLERRSLSSIRLPVAMVAGPILLSAAAITLNNAVIHGKPSLSPAGPSFFMANLIEYGPARRYLQEVCPQAGYKLCAKLDELPDTAFGLLWATDFYLQLGGFEAMGDEANSIVRNTIRTRPGEVASLAASLVVRAFLTRAPGAELGPVGNGFWMESTLEKRFGTATLRSYLASAQRNRLFPRDLLRRIDFVVFPLSLIFVAGAAAASAWYARWERFELCVLVVVGFAANAVLCSITSGVFDRYQARVSWLLPFTMLLIAMPTFNSLIERGRAPATTIKGNWK